MPSQYMLPTMQRHAGSNHTRRTSSLPPCSGESVAGSILGPPAAVNNGRRVNPATLVDTTVTGQQPGKPTRVVSVVDVPRKTSRGVIQRFKLNNGTVCLGREALGRIIGVHANTVTERIAKFGLHSPKVFTGEPRKRTLVKRKCEAPDCGVTFLVEPYKPNRFCSKRCAKHCKDYHNSGNSEWKSLSDKNRDHNLNSISVGRWEANRCQNLSA